jgi:ubiquinone/menaquinone biosynthesis C-methylase UbiE
MEMETPMTTTRAERHFLPAAGRDTFLPLYDPLTRILGVDGARRALLDQADLQPHHRVLDVGCGTGSLAFLIKQRYPTVTVIGVDPDPRALARAERKAKRAGVSIRFDRGFADALGHPDRAFDRVFSSMMFHHLEDDEKLRTLREIRRILRPGGRLELLDFAAPDRHHHSPLARFLHSRDRLKDNVEMRLLGMLANAGFSEPKKLADRRLVVGRVACFEATVPAMAQSGDRV